MFSNYNTATPSDPSFGGHAWIQISSVVAVSVLYSTLPVPSIHCCDKLL